MLSKVFLFLSGVLSQQGSDKVPCHISGRILFLTGYIFGLLCFSYFSANIVNTLTNTQSLDTLEQLINYKDIKLLGSVFPPFRLAIQVGV